MATILRVFNLAREAIGDLPECQDLTQQLVHNGVGVLSGSYPRSGVNASLLDLPAAYIAVVEDGWVQTDWHILEDDSDDNDTDPNRPITFAARSMLSMLEWAIVFPAEHSGSSLVVNKMFPGHKMTKATPGSILITLITKAKARGALDDLSYNFTATHDSEGNPWPTRYTITYAAGTTYLDIVQQMVEAGWIDVKTTGFTLNVNARGTMPVDRTQIIYRTGKDITTTSRTRSRRAVRNVILSVGEEANMYMTRDGNSIATYGRREGNASDGRMTVDGSLSQMGNSALAASKGVTDVTSLTVPVGDRGIPGEYIWRPNRDFYVGDYVYYDKSRWDGNDLRRLQVKAMTFTWATAAAGASCVLQFGELPTNWAVSANKRMTKVANAAIKPWIPNTNKPVVLSVAQTATAVTTPPKPASSPLPAPPVATMTFTATPSVYNEDGSDADPPSRFEYQWKYADMVGAAWSPPLVSDSTDFTLPSLIPGREVLVQVRAIKDGDPPLHSDWVQTTTTLPVPPDTTPPAAPSAPTATSRLGTVSVSWDGLTVTGDKMPPDFYLTEVHVATADGFTPSAATRRAEIYAGGGRAILTGLPYGTVYVRLVAVDTTGNRSDPSASCTVEVKALVDTDVIGKVVSGANIVDGSISAADKIIGKSVTTELLAAQAVQAGNVAANAITSDKLDAGAVNGMVITGAMLRTAETGARIEQSSDGYFQYAADGSIRIQFPTEDGAPNQFEGDIVANSITSNNRFAMRGIDNEVSKGGKLTLSNGTTAPTSAPSVAVSYEKYDGGITQYLYNCTGFHHDVDGTSAYFTGVFFEASSIYAPGGLKYAWPEVTSNDGSKRATRKAVSSTMVRTSGGGVRLVQYTGTFYEGGTTSGTWGLELLDPSTMNTAGTSAPASKAFLQHGVLNWNIAYKVGRCYSSTGSTTLDTNIALMEYDAGYDPDRVTFRRFNCTETAIAQQGTDLVVNSPLGATEEAIGVTYGSSAKMMFPGADQMVWLLHGSVNTYAFTAAGARIPDFDFPTNQGDKVVGSLGSLALGAMTFGGFRMAAAYRPSDTQPLLITKYTNNHWLGTTSGKGWVSHTWVDPDPAVETPPNGGVHETAQGPRAFVTMKKRAGLAITVPPFPARPTPTTTDDVLSARVYVGRGATDPGRLNMEYAGTVNSPTRSLLLGTFTIPTGAASSPPPATSNFPSSAPAAIGPAANTNWQLLGDGTAAFGGLTLDVNGFLLLQGNASIYLGDPTSTAQRTTALRAKATTGTNQYELKQYLGDGGAIRQHVTSLLQNNIEVVKTELFPDGRGLVVSGGGASSGVRPNGIVSSPMRSQEFKYTDATGLPLASATAVAMGARGGQGTFVAPPSGVVKIGFGALIQARTTGVYAAVAVEVRAGATIGAGTLVRGYSFNDAALHYAATLTNVWMETVVSGLVAGDTYNVQNMAACSDATAGANAYRARIVVDPQE